MTGSRFAKLINSANFANIITSPPAGMALRFSFMKFSEIPGNQEIKNKLVRTVLDQRVSHAQLFFGQEDSSKLALAVAYAQFINCTNKQGVPAKEQMTNDEFCGIRH